MNDTTSDKELQSLSGSIVNIDFFSFFFTIFYLRSLEFTISLEPMDGKLGDEKVCRNIPSEILGMNDKFMFFD